MYAGGTEGLDSSAGAVGRLIGTSRRRRSRSRATTVAMTRPTGDSRLTSGMASGAHGRNARLAIGDRDRRGRPVAVGRVDTTLGGGSLATPLLRNEELILHPLQLLRLRIAIVSALHG